MIKNSDVIADVIADLGMDVYLFSDFRMHWKYT